MMTHDYGDFEEAWQTLQLTVDGASSSPEAPVDLGATIRPGVASYEDLLRFVSLPTLELANDGLRKQELSLGDTLGEGGMGVVRLAAQVSLHREVAVKRVKSSMATPEATYKLLQEAWITGLLEHPNIIPIHQLGQDAEGQPMIVMKRIEGTAWRDVLAGEVPLPKALESEGKDDLECALAIFLDICRAVQFAHSKGIIHRDIKSENVMLGEHGEIYLVDWGLAVELRGGRAYLPKASEVKALAGTPAYMAPEMAAGKGEWLSEQTDVYLLGALLHEVITGQPPHQGNDLREVLYQSFRSAPYEYSEGVPEELAAICHKAMALQQVDRFESADALRQAVSFFLQHRHSSRMSADAAGRLAELCLSLEVPLPLREEQRLAIYNLFGQCRFGYEEALRIWPENRAAQAGLQSCLELMADLELRQRALQAASIVIAQLPQTNAELQQRLRALEQSLQDEEEEVEALKRFQQDHDVKAGAGTRANHIFFLGMFWSALCLAIGILEVRGVYVLRHSHFVWSHLGFAGIVTVSGWLRRHELLPNLASRRLFGAFVIGICAMALFGIGGWSLGLQMKKTFLMSVCVMLVVDGMLAVLIDWRIAGSVLVGLVAMAISLWKLQYVYFILAIGHALGFCILAYLWSPVLNSLLTLTPRELYAKLHAKSEAV